MEHIDLEKFDEIIFEEESSGEPVKKGRKPKLKEEPDIVKILKECGKDCKRQYGSNFCKSCIEYKG